MKLVARVTALAALAALATLAVGLAPGMPEPAGADPVTFNVNDLGPYVEQTWDELRDQAFDLVENECRAAFAGTQKMTASALDSLSEVADVWIIVDPDDVLVVWTDTVCTLHRPYQSAVCVGVGDSTSFTAFGCIPID